MKHGWANIYKLTKDCRWGGGRCIFNPGGWWLPLIFILACTNLQAQGFLVAVKGATPGHSPLSARVAPITSTATGGTWKDPATWVGGVVPGPGDNVVIANGASIIIDGNSAVCQTITIEGALHFNPGVSLEVNGDWINNGTVNAGTGTVFFKGTANSIIGGSSATAFNNLVVNKGTDITSVLEVVGPGAVSNYGTLTISNGLLKMATGSFQFGGTSNVTIPTTGGVWVNGGSLSSSYSVICNGYFKLSSGTVSIGTIAGNFLEMNQATGSTVKPVLEIEGGTLDVSGRLFINDRSSLNMTGGTVPVCTKGLNNGSNASFEVSARAEITMSGGNVVFQASNSVTAGGDLKIVPGTGIKTISGGSFQLGSSSSPPGSTFIINSAVPLYDLSIFNSSVKANLANDLTINNQLTLNGQLWLNDKNLVLRPSAAAINGSLGGTGGMVVTNGDGEVRKILAASGSYSFPVGTVPGSGTAEYSPVTITYAGTAGVKVSNTRHTGITNSTDFLKRFWSINSTGVTSASFDVTASYLAADVVGDETNIAAGRYGSTWTKHGVVNASLKSISVAGLTEKSTLAISGIALCTPPEKPTSGGNETVCVQSPVQTLAATATAPSSGSSVVWYDAATGGSVVSSPTLNAVGTVTYYAASKDNTDGCESVERIPVTLTINARPAPPTSNGDQAVCAASPVQTLTAAVTVPPGFSVVWYDANSGGNVVANPILNSVGSVTYYAALKDNATNCESASRTPVELTLQAQPTSFSVTGGGSYCVGDAGLPVGLSGSQTGVSYQLLKNGINIGSAVAGTGSAISFGNQTAAGTYTVVATNTTTSCTEPMTGSATISINPLPTAGAGSNSPVCTGSTLNLTASGGVSYSWTGPNNFSSGQQNPSLLNVTTVAGGSYTVTVTDGNNCSAQVSTAVTINPAQPVSVSIVSNDADNTICVGDAITFTATPTNGGTTPTYQWRVNGINVPGATTSTFTTSTLANGAVVQVVLGSNATPCATGSPATSNTIQITVNPIPSAPAAGNGGAVCVGGTISLTANAIAGATYSWTGPNGFTSTSQNPSITGATTTMAGTYSVIATVNGCTSPAATTTVTVNAIPATPTANSNSPVCAGTAINLSTPAVAGATYSWTGPNGFTSNVQNPTIANATIAMAGSYSVTVTVNGCTSAAGSTSVVVNTAPAAPTATNGGAVCVGGTINLLASTIAGASYAWTGPNGFTSALQNPTISGATAAMAGTYSVTATVAGCTSVAGTTNVVVNSIPSAPTAGSNSPVCVGSTINLTASTIANATYTWSGPNSFTSTAQNPSITNATAAMAGNYTVTVTVNGCTSPASAAATVVVNPIPSAPTAGNGGAVCVGGTINLSASTIPGASYSWTGPNGFTSSVQNPSRPGATTAMAGTYSVTATVNGCTSSAATTTVTVNTIPSTPTASSNSPVCAGTTINLTTPAVAGATYLWSGPNSFSSTSQNPTIANATAAMAGTYSVTVTVNGCTSAAGSTNVVVNATVTPSVSITSSSTTICVTAQAGSTPVAFTATPINGGTTPTYQWKLNGTNIPGATNSTYTANSLANNSQISVVITSNATCPSPATATSNIITMTGVNGNPGKANTPTSATASVCPPASGIQITTAALAGATTYDWALPTGWTITSGAGTNTITVSVDGTATTGNNNFSVKAGNACGYGGSSNNLRITVGSFAAVDAGADQNVCQGGTANLTATLLGNAASVTWSAPSGTFSSSNSVTTTYTPSITSGTVTLAVTTNDPAGSCNAGTDQVVITVNQPPSITTQPLGQTLCSGSAATFSVTATGTGLTYQWKKNSTNISGATSSSYTIPNVSAGDAGDYTVVVSGVSPCTPVTSSIATLVVNQAPAISVQPAALQTLCSGNAANFSVTATGTGLSYQWKKGGVDIPGATSSTYSIPNVTSADAGTYTVVVSGTAPCSSVTSQNAVLNVNQVVAITSQPTATQTLCSGSPASFSVTATGTGLTYQWKKNGADIPGATSATYSIPNVSASDAGTYTVVVSGAAPCSPVTSQNAVLNVNQIVAITAQPTGQTLCSGNAANFSVTATGTGLSYQWKKGGVDIPGATSSTYSIPNVSASNAGDYTVQVSGQTPCTPVTSAIATLAVNQIVAITTQPAASQTLCSGNAANFSVTATGAGLGYQWKKNGTDIPGATSSTYAIGTVSAAHAGTYTVVISGAAPCAPVTSQNAVLNVNDPVVITSQPAANQTVCSGFPVNFSVTATGTGLTYQWQKGGVNIPGATSASYSIQNASTSDAGTYTVVVSGVSPCPPVTSQNAVLDVKQDIAITSQPVAGQTLCVGTTATITVIATGNITDYVWRKNGIPVSNGGAISGATTATLTITGLTPADAGSYDVVISGPGGVCGQTISNPSTLTVNQNSTISLSSAAGSDAQTKCINTVITPITYTIAGGGTGATITGGALPAGVTGNFSNGVFTISGTPTAAGTFSYTVTTTGPCNNVSATGTITVNQNSTILLSSAAGTDAQTKCVNTPITPISYTIGGGGNGATISAGALPAGVTGNYSNSVFTISGTPTATGTFTYTVTTTGPCTNVSLSGTITVNQNSTISLSSAAGTDAQTKCINTPITPITYAIGGGGTGASITAGSLPTGMTGTYSNGVFTISGTPTAAGTFTYTVTTTGLCTNVSISGTIKIDGNSTLSLTSAPNTNDQTVCINSAITPITYTAGGGATGATVTGLPTGVTGTYSNNVLTISGTPTAAGTFNYTVITTGPCNNVSLNGKIIVNLNSTLALSSGSTNQSICVNNAIGTITYAVGGGATGATVTGLPTGVTGTYSNNVLTISGTPTAAGTFNYTVITTGPCVNPSLGGKITVDQTAVGGTLSPGVSTGCANANSGTITLSGYSGTIIRWESSTNGGGSWTPVNNTSTSLSYTNLSQATVYRVVIQSGSCPLVYSTNAVVSVIPPFTPTVSASPTTICLGQSANLSASGGVPTGSGLTGGDFNNGNPAGWCVDGGCSGNFLPANGNNTDNGPWRETNPHNFNGINYTSPDPKFAIASGNFNSKLETPVFSLVGQSNATLQWMQAYIFNGAANGTIEISTNGGTTYTTLATYTGSLGISGVNATMQSASLSLANYIGLSNLRLRFTYTGSANSAWTIDNINLPFTPPTVNYGWTLTNPTGVSSPYYLNSTNQQNVTATPPAVGTYTYQLATTVQGCPGGTASVQVVVNALPVINPVNSCIGGGIVTFGQTGGATGGTWSVSGGGNIDVGTGAFTPTIAGCFTVTYKTPGPGCTDTKSFVVFPAAPVLAAPANTCNAAFNLPSVPAVTGFSVEYNINNTGWAASPTIPTSPNCYSIQARYVLATACGSNTVGTVSPGCVSNTVNVVIFPMAPTPVVNSCGPIVITDPSPMPAGFTIQYSYDNGSSWGGSIPTADNCAGYNIKARYVTSAACGNIPAGTAAPGACESPAVTRKVDNTKPIVTCPIVPPACVVPSNSYTIPPATASDNCSANSALIITYSITGATTRNGTGLDASGIFNIGVSTITWTVIDECGNSNTCTTKVTINPKPVPVIYHN